MSLFLLKQLDSDSLQIQSMKRLKRSLFTSYHVSNRDFKLMHNLNIIIILFQISQKRYYKEKIIFTLAEETRKIRML